MLSLQLSNLAGFHTPLLTVTLNMPFTIWRTSIERAAWVKSSHYHLTAAAQSPQLFEAYRCPLQHLCESTSNESSLVTEPPKKSWKPSSGPILPKPPKKLPTAADPNSIRNLYKEKTWIEHDDSYNPPPLEFKGPGPGLTANCRGLPSMLHLFGLLWTRDTLRRIVVETNRYVTEHIQVRIPENICMYLRLLLSNVIDDVHDIIIDDPVRPCIVPKSIPVVGRVGILYALTT